MSNHKQFGVWMDNHHAQVVGKVSEDADFSIIANLKQTEHTGNSNENAGNNHERTLQAGFFKNISSNVANATAIHVTGTGQAQEQFIKYLADTPQFKNCKTDHSTSNKMSDEKLVEFIDSKF